MTKSHSEIDGARRGFFRAVAGAGVAAGTGALILRGTLERTEAKPSSRTPPASTGYRETAHIRKYYETTRG